MNWLDICALDEINPLNGRVVAGPKGDIAISSAADDQSFALDDRCPHKWRPAVPGPDLRQAMACPLHNWQIELESGRSRAPDQVAYRPGAGGERAGAARPGQRGCAPDLSPITEPSMSTDSPLRTTASTCATAAWVVAS